MKTIYFDCFSGVSGDKILGSLVDAGLELTDLRAELAKLNVAGFNVTAEKAIKKGITGTRVIVTTEEQKAHRHLKDIETILRNSSLGETTVKRSLAIFTRLAEAEARIHGTTPEKIHFHEVGALDAIVDIVGAVVGLQLLQIDRVVCSPIATGTGFVECEHGTIPVPAPATLELLRGFPLQPVDIKSELATPTGAAIMTTLADQFGPMPAMAVASIGYGAGYRDLEIPNHLRVMIGQSQSNDIRTEMADLIETNIDDMNPELFEHVGECLRAAGAVDLFFTPIQMKKNRPAVMLSVLSPVSATDRVIEALFRETSSIGLRQRQVIKKVLPRQIIKVDTPFGSIAVKVCRLNGQVINIAPEYEDCHQAALEHNQPISDIYDLARQHTRELLRSEEAATQK